MQWTRFSENSTLARDTLPLGKEMAECYGNIDSHPKDTGEKSKYLLKYTHRRDWDANNKAECRGISYTFDGLLKYLDIDDRTQNVTVIAIQRKRKESKRSLFTKDFWGNVTLHPDSFAKKAKLKITLWVFGIVKASIGMPTSTGELTEMLLDAS